MNYINKRIIDLCEARGWSLYMLSERSDIPYSSLNSSINRDSSPKLDAIERICKVFGISLSQFFLNGEEYEVVTERERELLALFRNLSKEKQTALISLLEN